MPNQAGLAFRQRFSGCGERRCAYKLQLSAAMYAQMYAQTWGHSSGGGGAVAVGTSRHPVPARPSEWTDVAGAPIGIQYIGASCIDQRRVRR